MLQFYNEEDLNVINIICYWIIYYDYKFINNAIEFFSQRIIEYNEYLILIFIYLNIDIHKYYQYKTITNNATLHLK